MRRVLLIVVPAIVLVLVVVVAVLAAFPPRPHTVPVEHTLPNDRFGTH